MLLASNQGLIEVNLFALFLNMGLIAYRDRMTKDLHLRAQQHQNELRAFLRYEQRLKQAYARSQNPFPRRWQPDGHCRRVQIDG